MNRRLFNFMAATWLTLSVVVGALWARSFASETILLESRRGQCVLIGIDCSRKAVRTARDGADTLESFLAELTARPPGLIIGSTGRPPTPPREHRWLGFLLVRGDWCQIRDPSAEENFWHPPFWVLGVPYWFIALLTTAIPARWLWLYRRSAQRRSRGLCLACGYDLRATAERCPECGAAPEPPHNPPL
jgi:hypothetical protein